jgi:hypothetical protein
MINLPNSLSKGITLNFTLNKNSLFSVIEDDYFSIAENVKKIVFVYKSTTNNQRKRIEFLTSEEIPSANVVFSNKASNEFSLEKIILIDYDDGAIALSKTIVSVNLRTISFIETPPSSEDVFFAFSGTNDANLGGFNVGAFFN